MSKSQDNSIILLSTPEDMYGKIMSVPDAAMPMYHRLVTRWTPPEIETLEAEVASGKLHPRDAKMRVAREIVSIYHSPEAAEAAERAFVRVFQQGGQPEEMPEMPFQPGQTILDTLLAGKLVSSRSEGRRMLEQGGVRLDGQTLQDGLQPLPHPGVLQVGKRKFIKLV